MTVCQCNDIYKSVNLRVKKNPPLERSFSVLMNCIEIYAATTSSFFGAVFFGRTLIFFPVMTLLAKRRL